MSKKAHRGLAFIYNGRSMTPTFCAGQLLYVQPETQNLRPGDVIVYSTRFRGEHIVHRIVDVASTGLTTRGDHNFQCDELQVAYGQVVGQVDAVDHDGVVRNVIGGRLGLWKAKVRWFFLGLWAKVRPVLVVPYLEIIVSTVKCGWIKRVIKLRFEFIIVQTTEGPIIKALHRGRVVARWKQSLPSFECRKPYDLWLGESDLEAIWSEKNPQEQ
jgi:hypothetical protein